MGNEQRPLAEAVDELGLEGSDVRDQVLGDDLGALPVIRGKAEAVEDDAARLGDDLWSSAWSDSIPNSRSTICELGRTAVALSAASASR